MATWLSEYKKLKDDILMPHILPCEEPGIQSITAQLSLRS